MRALLVFLATAAVAAAEERLPGDAPVTSPRGTFSISQRHDETWHTTIQFKNPRLPSVTLADDDYSWAAQFYISPDDQWVLQIQKTASGSNSGFLFRVEPSGRVWRMEHPLDASAFRFLEEAQGLSTAHLYHARIEFIDWDMAAGALRFSIHASSSQDPEAGVAEQMVYDLKKHAFRIPKP